jgi:hypothetical protein
VSRAGLTIPEGYARAAAEMEAEVVNAPGYLGHDSVASLRAGHYRQLLEGRGVRRRLAGPRAPHPGRAEGRERWYDWYRLVVANVSRAYDWQR